MTDLQQQQRRICAEHGSDFIECSEARLVGVARQTLARQPVYGLRHAIEGQGSGWFLWAGDAEIPPAPDFFQPVPLTYVAEQLPGVLKFLGLAPGHGFVIDDRGYVDVWYDAKLLEAA